jgi:isoprenylcysteine carboxyl methyltransferase (ICMT) family protein YpbQ
MSARPSSASNVWANAVAYGAAGLFLAACAARGAPPVATALGSLLLAAGLMAAHDLAIARVHRRPGAGLGTRRPANARRIAVKLVGAYGTFAVVFGAYWALLPLAPDRFGVVIALLPVAWIALAILCPVYMIFVDARMDEPEDDYWLAGRLFLGRLAYRELGKLKHYALGWIVKGFFLPLMAGSLFVVTARLMAMLSAGITGIVPAFHLIFQYVLFLDLCVAVLGYILTLRLLDTHIRSCNTLLWGWCVTLACYYPFWAIVYENLLRYGDGARWDDWLSASPLLLALWGGMIVVVKLAWLWANISFGLRFSNLTHRGILTGGPFRYTKHPSYLSKNIGFWLISMPFLSSQGWDAAAGTCAALLGVNAIYILRAKCEERHLSEDPVYVRYALWIDDHGLFARLGRVFPFLRYAPPLRRADGTRFV